MTVTPDSLRKLADEPVPFGGDGPRMDFRRAIRQAANRIEALDTEVKAQHDEHVARYGQAMMAESKVAALEAQLKAAEAVCEAANNLREAMRGIDADDKPELRAFHAAIAAWRATKNAPLDTGEGT